MLGATLSSNTLVVLSQTAIAMFLKSKQSFSSSRGDGKEVRKRHTQWQPHTNTTLSLPFDYVP